MIPAPSPFEAGGDTEQDLKLREAKPPIVNQQCLVYSLNVTCAVQVMLVSHTAICTKVLKNTKTLLHQLASIFATNMHSLAPKDLTKNFSVLMKCTNKFDTVYKMFFIHETYSQCAIGLNSF